MKKARFSGVIAGTIHSSGKNRLDLSMTVTSRVAAEQHGAAGGSYRAADRQAQFGVGNLTG